MKITARTEQYQDMISRLYPFPYSKKETNKIQTALVTFQVTDACPLRCSYCVTGDTEILMSDYSHKKIKDIVENDEILGFEEIPQKGKQTKVIPAKVTHLFQREAEVWEIVMESGERIKITPNHKVLVRRNSWSNHQSDFIPIEKLDIGRNIFIHPLATLAPIKSYRFSDDYKIGYLIGMLKGDGSLKHYISKEGYDVYKFRLAVKDIEIINRVKNFLTDLNIDFYTKLYEVSKKDKLDQEAIFANTRKTFNDLNTLYDNHFGKNNNRDYLIGYLAGFYDAEGHISDGRIIRICNTDIEMIQEAERGLKLLEIPYVIENTGSTKNKEHKYNIRILAQKNALQTYKFLSIINSSMPRKSYEKFINYSPLIKSKIKEINKLGIEKVYNIETTSHTYIANGVCVHNCYQINKGQHRMPLEVAKKFIDMLLENDSNTQQYIDTSCCDAIIIEFIGGEPLLEIELIEQIMEYFMLRVIETNHKWQYNWQISISSNGVLYFNPEVQKFINKWKQHLSFSVSVDGNKQLHDACRVFPDGSGSYDKAIAAVHHYRDVLGQYMGSKMTLAPANVKYTYEAIKSLIEDGYTEINANCVFEEGWTTEDATTLYYQLKDLANYILDNDLEEKVYVSLFEEKFFCPKSLSDQANWCGGSGSMIAIDWKGDIYPCLRFMESSLGPDVEPVIIGNIETGIMTDAKCRNCVQRLKGITRSSQSTQECIECPIAEGCAWCFPAGTKIKTPNGYKNIEDLQINDEVLDKEGNIQVVENNLTRIAKEDLIYVNAAGILEQLTTKEHPFWCRPFIKRNNNIPIYGEPQWIKAQDLKVSDRIALYIPTPGAKDINKDFAYVIGRYVGDGWKTLSHRELHPYRYYICTAFEEQEEFENKLNNSGIKYSKTKNRTVEEYNLNITGNEYMVSLLNDCGLNAQTKRVPKEVWNWNKSSIEAFLKGYFDADGSFDLKNSIQRFTTISYNLLLGISELVRMVFHKNVNINIANKKTEAVIEGRIVKTSISYEGRFKTITPQRKYYSYDEINNIMWINVSSTTGLPPKEQEVYNLTVSNTHNFIANGIIVHNCTAYNWQSQGDFNKRATYICVMHKARALANCYFWNLCYWKHKENNRMKLWLPEEECLKIIPQEELDKLKLVQYPLVMS